MPKADIVSLFHFLLEFLHPYLHIISLQLASAQIRGAVMKTPVKPASPFSAVACFLLLLSAGMLVKFAAWTPMFHIAHWN